MLAMLFWMYPHPDSHQIQIPEINIETLYRSQLLIDWLQIVVRQYRKGWRIQWYPELKIKFSDLWKDYADRIANIYTRLFCRQADCYFNVGYFHCIGQCIFPSSVHELELYKSERMKKKLGSQPRSK